VTRPSSGPAHQRPTTLRPALREAAHALRIATDPTIQDGGRPHSSQRPDPTGRGDGLPDHAAHRDRPAPETDTQVADEPADETDDEAAAIAELGQLLDALSDTVTCLAGASRSPRRARLRSLESRLTEIGLQATSLSTSPGRAPTP
jgi:hypothetical protein